MIKDHGIFPVVIILLILITLSLDNVWILLGENCFWSLLALKGLRGINLMKQRSVILPKSFAHVFVVQLLIQSYVFPLGNYMFIETSYPRKRGDRARLESEIFPPTPSNGRCMSFWYHMKGGHIGTLNVYMRIYGQSETKLWSMSLDQGDRWNSAVVPILSGNRYYQVWVRVNEMVGLLPRESVLRYVNKAWQGPKLRLPGRQCD